MAWWCTHIARRRYYCHPAAAGVSVKLSVSVAVWPSGCVSAHDFVMTYGAGEARRRSTIELVPIECTSTLIRMLR